MARPTPQYQIQLTAVQVRQLTQLSQCYAAPFCEVQRARLLLLAHQGLANAEIARRLGCSVQTVRNWRKRWLQSPVLKDAPRAGRPRSFTPTQRAAITALACSSPATHGKAFKRWSSEQLASLAVEKKLVPGVSPSTVRRWLRAERIKPWQYHSWQKSTDPQFVEKATPGLELYATAAQLEARGEAIICSDEKTSIQARQRLHATKPAIRGHPRQVADRYQRMGAVQLFCALLVATGVTFARTCAGRKFADFQRFLSELFASALCQGKKVVHLILDNGSTHAPKQIGPWIASLKLSFEVRLYWLPKYASWLDQVEIIFSKVQRDVLTPNDFASTQALEHDLAAYFKELNQHPKPVHWSYTKERMLLKFGVPQP